MLKANLDIYRIKLLNLQIEMARVNPPKNQDEATKMIEIYKRMEKLDEDFRLNKPPLTLLQGGKP